MSTTRKQEDSEDEFESADEGEPTVEKAPVPIVKCETLPSAPRPVTPPSPINRLEVHSPPSAPPPVTEGWGDWTVDDEPLIEQPLKNRTTISNTLPQQDSLSSLSSSPSKAGSNSPAGSDDDEQTESSGQPRLLRKKFRKKQLESNVTLDKDEEKTNTSKTTARMSHETEEKSDSFTVAAAETTAVTKHNVQDAHDVLDRLSAESSTRAPTWHKPWSNFGSFLSTAKQSVTTLTSTVSEGFSAVIESVEAGLGAPDPQELAEMNRMALKIKGETSDSEEEPETLSTQAEKDDSVTNQDGWLNALSLDKLTTTGMKVVSGSLDVLETVGKKTFDVINEADPELKGTRRLLGKQNRPTLSEMIREAQHERQQQEVDTSKSTKPKNETVTFFELFEKNQGLAHFEALELLANQSAAVLQTMSHGNEKLLEHIATFFETSDDVTLDDGDENRSHLDTSSSTNLDDKNDHDIPSLDVLSQKFTAYQSQLRSTVPVDKLLEVYESANEFLKEWEWMDTELDQKTLSDEAIDSLAILCARITEYYRKTAELFLLGCKSLTSFSVDIELLSIYQKQQHDFSRMLAGIPNLFAKHMRQISNLPSSSTTNNPSSSISSNQSGIDMPVRCDPKTKQKLLNQMYIQSSSSQTYAADAYALLKPIVSQSILYHTSTTR